MSTPRALVIGNWKMNLDFVDALHLVQQLGVLVKNRPLEHVDVVLAPPFVDLRTVSSVIEAERFAFHLAAQHVSAFESGAHTGEISASMLKRLNVSWVIVGHSERRTQYAMTDDVVRATLGAVVRSGQHAVLCVGEESAVRDRGHHAEFVASQLRDALDGLEERFREQVTVAYEPLWAIGSGVTASPDDVLQMADSVRAVLRSLSLSSARVLYGGSVTGENAGLLVRGGGVDGFLVGGASLKAASFHAILQACDDCYARKR